MALRNAFEELATEATLDTVRDTLVQRSSSSGDAHLVSGNKTRWRREFNDPTLSEWTVAGSGMGTQTVANGNLTLAAGTTAGATWSLTSNRSFTAPFKAQFGFQVSQKIINNEFYLEIVAETPDGLGVDETVVAAWRLSGTDTTTTTTYRTEVRNGGAARLQSSSIAGGQSQTAGGIFEITLESDEVWFHSRAVDSTAAKSSSSSVRNSTAPDPNRKYRIRIRAANGATAPVSSTTMTLSFVTVVDYTEFNTEITGGTGSQTLGQATPVVIANVPATTVSWMSANASATPPTALKINTTASTNAAIVRATANSRLYGYYFTNLATTTRFVRLYNKLTIPSPGTDSPTVVLAIPAGQTLSMFPPVPIMGFALGIGIAITAGAADLDATATAAGDVIGMVYHV